MMGLLTCLPWRLILLSTCVITLSSTSPDIYDYIVVGAGPGGLQMAHFLQKAGRSYVVLERSNISGSFFTTYPRHDKLISINKRFTGQKNKEFNFRHDWNSLISDDDSLQFRHYSEEFFPHRETMIKYLHDYSQKLNLNIQYNTEVSNIERKDREGLLYMQDQHEQVYKCRTLIVATGLWKPYVPRVNGSELFETYDTLSTNPKDYEGQSVLILGKGNTGYEVADSIYGSTSSVHMLSRSRVRLSWSTHYVGDLRAVNNGLLDTYQLKSLDGILEADIENVSFFKKNGRIHVGIDDDEQAEIYADNFPAREGYDRVLSCLGWVFDASVFADNAQISLYRKKYPEIYHDYESKDILGVYIAGTATHSLDFRKSAGGFIHGFRYTAQALHRLLEWKNHGVVWPSVTLPIENLLNHMIKRINEASSIYQMFSVLGDVISISHDNKNYTYFESFPVALLDQFEEKTGFKPSQVLVVLLEYGKEFSGPGKDVFGSNRATGDADDAHSSNFLHPVFYYYSTLPSKGQMQWEPPYIPTPDKLHHCVEDFLTTFTGQETHILPIRRFLDEILHSDSRHVFAADCLQLSLTMTSVPDYCEKYLTGRGLLLDESIVNFNNVQTQLQLN